MMHLKNNRTFRLFALFTALALLPSLFFGNSDNNRSEKGQLHSAHNYISLSECDMHRHPAAVCILFVSLKLKAGNVNFSLRTIIKYIQDQDGIKI